MHHTDIAQAAAAANRIRGMRCDDGLESKGREIGFATAKEGEKEIRGVKIELRDVWFRYPTRDVPVLAGLDMTVSLGTAKDKCQY